MKEQKDQAEGPGASKAQGPRCGTVTSPRPAMAPLAPPPPEEAVRFAGMPLPVPAPGRPPPQGFWTCSLCKSHIPLDRGSRDPGPHTLQEMQCKQCCFRQEEAGGVVGGGGGGGPGPTPSVGSFPLDQTGSGENWDPERVSNLPASHSRVPTSGLRGRVGWGWTWQER